MRKKFKILNLAKKVVFIGFLGSLNTIAKSVFENIRSLCPKLHEIYKYVVRLSFSIIQSQRRGRRETVWLHFLFCFYVFLFLGFTVEEFVRTVGEGREGRGGRGGRDKGEGGGYVLNLLYMFLSEFR